ncbi:MAG: hypothetical protein WEA28_17015 [Xanthobacteraceae bacterium]
MLENGGLYFSRGDLLEDRFEGSYTNSTIQKRPQIYQVFADQLNKNGDPVTGDELSQEVADLFRKSVNLVYVNCWHQNEYESVAMWKLYAPANESIAIVSTVKKLIDALDDSCIVSSVTYLDYGKDHIDDWNMFSGFLHKRISFEHERESCVP